MQLLRRVSPAMLGAAALVVSCREAPAPTGRAEDPAPAVPTDPGPPPAASGGVRLVIGSPGAARTFGVGLGDRLGLTVTARDAAGAPVALSDGPTFLSRAPDTVAVSETGVLSALRTGEARIVVSARAGGAQLIDSVSVLVLCSMELVVRITPGSRTIAVGESFVPAVGITSCGGRVAVSDTLEWSAQDTSVVQVDRATGRVTGRSPGTSVVAGVGRIARGAMVVTVAPAAP